MMLSKNILTRAILKRLTLILFTILVVSACRAKTFQTTCQESDTSTKMDFNNDNKIWRLSESEVSEIVSLIKETDYESIYLRNDISTCEVLIPDVSIDAATCDLILNAGSYGYAKCRNGKNYHFGCYDKKCEQYFPFPYDDNVDK